MQFSAAAQATTGQLAKGANFSQLEPDVGVSWLQPGTRFGALQLELHGTERRDTFHLGRVYGAMRDLKRGDYKWTVEAGDTYSLPTVGEYNFSHLVTPSDRFTGGAVAARLARLRRASSAPFVISNIREDNTLRAFNSAAGETVTRAMFRPLL